MSDGGRYFICGRPETNISNWMLCRQCKHLFTCFFNYAWIGPTDIGAHKKGRPRSDKTASTHSCSTSKLDKACVQMTKWYCRWLFAGDLPPTPPSPISPLPSRTLHDREWHGHAHDMVSSVVVQGTFYHTRSAAPG